MFRNLFAIETAALRCQAQVLNAREFAMGTDDGVGDIAQAHLIAARERAIQALPLCPGIWALRSPV